MTTPRKSELSKAAGMFRRAFVQAWRSIPPTLRQHWLTILFPVRLIPRSIALALIALVALAMIVYPPVEEVASSATIGGTVVPPTLACYEDEAIAFVGIPDLLVCVHVDSLAAR